MKFETLATVGRPIKRGGMEQIPMFRMGDFYEAFDGDALTLGKYLDVPVTSRGFEDREGRAKMAGVPFHSVAGYVAKLRDAGLVPVLIDLD